MKSIKKIYRIKDKRNGEYVRLGYERKSTWLLFPSAVIQTSIDKNDYDNYQVDMFEANPTKSFTLDKKEI